MPGGVPSPNQKSSKVKIDQGKLYTLLKENLLEIPNLLKVVDSCRNFSTKSSDTFRSLCIWKGARISKKKICLNRAKKLTLLRGFDRKNTLFEISRNLIRKARFQVTLNVRKS